MSLEIPKIDEAVVFQVAGEILNKERSEFGITDAARGVGCLYALTDYLASVSSLASKECKQRAFCGFCKLVRKILDLGSLMIFFHGKEPTMAEKLNVGWHHQATETWHGNWSGEMAKQVRAKIAGVIYGFIDDAEGQLEMNNHDVMALWSLWISAVYCNYQGDNSDVKKEDFLCLKGKVNELITNEKSEEFEYLPAVIHIPALFHVALGYLSLKTESGEEDWKNRATTLLQMAIENFDKMPAMVLPPYEKMYGPDPRDFYRFGLGMVLYSEELGQDTITNLLNQTIASTNRFYHNVRKEASPNKWEWYRDGEMANSLMLTLYNSMYSRLGQIPQIPADVTGPMQGPEPQSEPDPVSIRATWHDLSRPINRGSLGERTEDDTGPVSWPVTISISPQGILSVTPSDQAPEGNATDQGSDQGETHLG
jgi:hypothetical protein